CGTPLRAGVGHREADASRAEERLDSTRTTRERRLHPETRAVDVQFHFAIYPGRKRTRRSA
ncbi:MAG: hypothetical protein ACXWZG_00185, partial [Microbacterium sp.]